MENTPEQTLSHVREIQHRARTRAHGGVWFPVAVIAGLLLLSIGLYARPFLDLPRVSFAYLGPVYLGAPSWAGLPAPQRDPVLSYAFWFILTPLAFGIIAWWYRRRERSVGVTVAWRRVLVVGLGALVALAVVAAIPSTLILNGDDIVFAPTTPAWYEGLRTPLLPIALALMVLGWTERSLVLALAGGWIGLIAWWYQTAGMGRVPGWLVYVLSGFSGPALGGTVHRFDRPGPTLLLLALPLVVYAAIRGRRARGGHE